MVCQNFTVQRIWRESREQAWFLTTFTVLQGQIGNESWYGHTRGGHYFGNIPFKHTVMGSTGSSLVFNYVWQVKVLMRIPMTSSEWFLWRSVNVFMRIPMTVCSTAFRLWTKSYFNARHHSRHIALYKQTPIGFVSATGLWLHARSLTRSKGPQAVDAA